MDTYKELLDFSGSEKRIPCALCGKESSPTIIGNHFKCAECDHLFNQDGSSLPEQVECHCEKCTPRPTAEELDTRLISKVKRKIASVKKKLKRKRR